MFEITKLQIPIAKSVFTGQAYLKLKGDILALLFEQRTTVFDKETSASGPWQPIKNVDAKLSKSRKDYKKNSNSVSSKKMRENDKILHDKGVLRASFTGEGQGSDHSIEGDEVMLVTNVEYAAIQNFGSKDESRQHPPRPFNEFSDEDNQEINLLIQGYIEDAK